MSRRTGNHLVALAIVMLACTSLFLSHAEEMTVGQFLQELARVRNLTATDPQVAADSLGASGVRLPDGTDLSAPLTEGDVAEISKTVGLTLQATEPSALFTGEQVDRFFAVFSNDLGASSGDGITIRAPGDCVLTALGECALPGANCLKGGKTGFCQPANGNCTCNTGQAKGKRKQVITPGEPD